MSENNESGNRWEAEAPTPVVEPAETSEADATTVTPPARTITLPTWVTKRGLVATGTAAAFFLGGGGVGYAVGAHGHDDSSRPFPGRFDRSGFGPGQLPGGGQGNFGGPQGQSEDDSGSDSSSGTQS